MRISVICANHGTSLHRARAMERLGHSVTVIDPWAWFGKSRWAGIWQCHLGALGSNIWFGARLLRVLQDTAPELVWIDQGEWIGPSLIRAMRRHLRVPLVNYTIDDPFGSRDGLRFAAYLRAVPEYDLLIVVRQENVAEASTRGAHRVLRVWRSADEVAHRPRNLTPEQQARFASEVAFVGTWMPERGPFMVDLIQRGVPLSIRGNGWQKAPEWPHLAEHWRGPGLTADDDYAAAILAAKINIGLLSKGNRDLHTTRSLEIPALGGLFCAERTIEHSDLYEEDREAVFWRDGAECAERCLALLTDAPRRHAIAKAGHARAMSNGHYNERVMKQILDAALGQAGLPSAINRGKRP
jgi:hypothetical protein